MQAARHLQSLLRPSALLLTLLTACAAQHDANASCQAAAQDATDLLQLSHTARRDFVPSFGGIVPGHPLYRSLPGKLKALPPDLDSAEVPEEFDSRKTWPHCSDVISHISDQSRCGSCWAVGSAGTLNDRFCVFSGDNVTMLSSFDPLANCNTTDGSGGDMSTCVNPVGGGCHGGQLEFVWKWYEEQGTVNGNGFNNSGFTTPLETESALLQTFSPRAPPQDSEGLTCAPYPFPPCHMPEWKNSMECNKSFETPASFTTCPTQGYQPPYRKDKVKVSSWYKLPNDTKAIQLDILRHGSVSCQVSATCSMTSYTGGVYTPSGKVCGGHVMRITGWGIEEEAPYWWVANSWGPDWGLNGFIKWIRGVDAQGIESGIVAGVF